MADALPELELLQEIQTELDAVERLLSTKGAFEAALKAFRAEDPKAFHSVLERAALQIRCHYVCRWIRIKECVFLCYDLAGPPTPFERPPDPRVLAKAIGRLSADEKLVKKLAEILEKRDRKGFLDVVKRLEIEPYAHFFCHWLCVIRYRLVCRWICLVDPRPPVLWAEILAAARTVGALAANERLFKAVSAASAAGDAVKLADALRIPDFQWRCHFICEFFCSWRCVLLCPIYARPFPYAAIKAAAQIREAQAFAETIVKLSKKSDALQQLIEVVASGKADRWSALVKEYQLERYALQLCHWVCGWRCYRFCYLVCPPVEIIPIFDHVGAYRVDPFFNDFTADGTTTAGGYAFTGTIPLIGLLPPSPVANPIEYRFTVKKLPGGAAAPLTATEITGSVIGSLEFWEWDATALPAPGQWKLRTTDYTINNTAGFYDIQQNGGPPLHVQVTTPIAADGWVRVPTNDNLTQGGGGKFVATHLLAALDTTKLTLEQFDLHGPGTGLPIVAGAPVPTGPPAADNKRSEKPVFQINFEARRVFGAVPISSNGLPKIALSNIRYAFDRHPDWAGSTITLADGYPQALLLDIKELRTVGGCSPLNKTMTAEFTAYHPYLASCHLYLEGPAPPLPAVLPDVNPAIDAAGQATSTPAGMVFDISKLKPCAYILWIKTTVNLTSGYGALGGVYDDHIAFCLR